MVRVPLGAVDGAALGLGVPLVLAGEGVHRGELVFVEERSITAMFDHNNNNKGWNHSVVAFADEGAQDDVGEVLGDGVGVVDRFYHLDVELPLALRELGLEHHEEILPTFLLESYLLREGRHLARSEVYPPFQLPRAVAEEEHVGVVLPPETLESAHDREGIEGLPVEDGVLGELVVDLEEGKGDYGLVVDGFVVFLAGIRHLPPDNIIAEPPPCFYTHPVHFYIQFRLFPPTAF